MRPASEIHTAIDILDSELSRNPNDSYQIARDVLAWVAGGDVDLAGPRAWLAAFLLDDPEQIGPPPGDN